MYYVNKEQIEQRLSYIPVMLQAAEQISDVQGSDIVQKLALERILHVAIEVVTDVGSYLIDGFIMRDASSYEDIIEILADERVIPDGLTPTLLNLVGLRKPLVQQYYQLDEAELRAYLDQSVQALLLFSESVRAYLLQEGV